MKDFPTPASPYVPDWEPGEPRVSKVDTTSILNVNDLLKQPSATLTLAIDAANLHMQQLTSSFESLDQKCLGILAGLVAIFVALLGGLFALISLDIHSAIVPMVVGLVCCIVCSVHLFCSTMHKRSSYYAGEAPRNFFPKKYIDMVEEGVKHDLDAEKLHKAYYLFRVQQYIDYNIKEKIARVCGYRRTLYMIGAGLSLTALTTILSCLPV